MTETGYVSMLDLAAGGLVLAAVFVVWRRDLGAIVRLLAVQGIALAAIPLVQGAHHSEIASLVVGLVVLALRGVVLPLLLGRAAGAERREYREATPLVNTASSLLVAAALVVHHHRRGRRHHFGAHSPANYPPSLAHMPRNPAISQVQGHGMSSAALRPRAHRSLPPGGPLHD